MGFSPQLRFSTCIFLLLQFVAQGTAVFNCTRSGCNNGGVCDVGGSCICVGSTFTGYDCSQDQRFIMHGACLTNNPCLNGATCYDPATTGTVHCYCPYEFYGTYCQLPTVQNECFSDQMIVNVNPGPSFVGVVGIQHSTRFCELASANSQIQFSLDPARSEWQGYAAILPFFGTIPCGAGATATPMIGGAEMTYTYDVIVRYGGKPELDELISFSCTVPYAAGAMAGPTAVLFSVTDAQGIAVDRPKVGSSVTVTFRVDPTSIFTDVAVRSCTVFNTMKTVSKAVVTNSCPVQPVGMSLVKNGDKHVLTMRVHMFRYDPSLNFECSVKVCTAADYTCQQMPVCPGISSMGTSDLLGLLMPSPSGGSTNTGSVSFNDLLGGTMKDLMGSSSATGGTGSSSSDLSGSMSNLLGASPLGDLFSAGPASGTSTGRRRRRRDVTEEEQVIFNLLL